MDTTDTETTGLTAEVFEEYEIVRVSGACNMLDKMCVLDIASELDLDALIEVIEAGQYINILRGYGTWKDSVEAR